MGSIALGNISQVYKINKSCVYIRDNEGDSWKICSRDGDITTWYEGLKGIFTMKQAQEAAAVAQAAATSEEGEVVEGEAVEGEAAVEAKEAPKEV